MSILSFPPELLYNVFSHTLGSGPSGPFSYPAIAHDLCTFSLVHSTWSKPAQATLQKEVFAMVNPKSEGAERMIKEKGCLLVEKGLRGTKFLTIVGNLESFLEATGNGMWTEVVVLQFQHWTQPLALIGIEFFSRFPRLEKLSLLFGVLGFKPLAFDCSFTNLRTLAVTYLSLAGTPSDLQRIISPACMPNLVHLACDAASSAFPLETVIINVLPQLKTLRITDERSKLLDITLCAVLTQATNLVHLAPDCCNTEFYGIFDDTVKLDIESLHLSEDHSQFADFVLPLLVLAAKGEHKMVKFKRVVLYGSKEKWNCDLPHLDLSVLEWRENEDKPSFDGFDGE